MAGVWQLQSRQLVNLLTSAWAFGAYGIAYGVVSQLRAHISAWRRRPRCCRFGEDDQFGLIVRRDNLNFALGRYRSRGPGGRTLAERSALTLRIADTIPRAVRSRVSASCTRGPTPVFDGLDSSSWRDADCHRGVNGAGTTTL